MRRLTTSELDLLDAIKRQLATRPSSVVTPEILDQASHLVRSMTDPRPQLSELVGPVCTTADVVDWLGISRQGINKAVREDRILAIQSPSTTWFYPTWQLMDDHSVVPTLSSVLGRFTGRMDRLVAAQWFHDALPALEGMSPAQWMLDGLDLHTVVGEAESFARSQSRHPSDQPLYDPEIATSAR